MSIIAYPLEATEYTAEDVQSYLSTRTSGVFSDDITFTPEGMTVTVSPFLAWFNYAKFKGCSVAVTEPETLTFSPAHSVLDRIDRIVLRVDFTLNKAYFTIIEGTPSSTPIPPDVSKTEIVNDISPVYVRIRAGATEITPADITSTILDESVCGIMRDSVTGIPTAQLQAQVEELILRLHKAIDGVESGSAFMIGDLYDPQKKAKPVAFNDEVFPIDGSKSITGSTVNIFNYLAQIFANVNQIQMITRSVPQDIYNYRMLALRNSVYVPDIKNAIRVIDIADGKSIGYDLFGHHNKPTGTYTGNGTARTIVIGGIGNCLYVHGSDATEGFICSNYGFVFRHWSTGTSEIIDPVASFNGGNLHISDSNVDIINTPGVIYTYQVL